MCACAYVQQPYLTQVCFGALQFAHQSVEEMTSQEIQEKALLRGIGSDKNQKEELEKRLIRERFIYDASQLLTRPLKELESLAATLELQKKYPDMQDKKSPQNYRRILALLIPLELVKSAANYSYSFNANYQLIVTKNTNVKNTNVKKTNFKKTK